ncbi:MAG: Ig-like domain-containing protein, partial [Aestuariivirga sp.]
MWKPRPVKWLLWAPPMVVLTALPAYLLNTGQLNRDISSRVTGQLFAAGANWAVPSFDGRDVTLSGDAPSQKAMDSAMQALAGVYGVRTIANGARIVAPLPPVALVAPGVNSLTTNSATPEVTGTWQEGVAKTLTVTLAGKTYTFGADPELSSSAGAWLLKPSAPLADGSYEIGAAVSDGVNPAIGATAPATLVIDTVAPVAPAIIPLASGVQWPFTLNGTWAEGDAVALLARLADQTWTLGKDADLKSDGKGNWSFAPVVDLRPGSYDITVESSDAAGNTSKSTLAAAIVIAAPVTAPAAAIPAPVVTAPAEPPPVEPAPAAPAAPAAAAVTAPALQITTAMEARPTLTGTWPEGVAKGLSIGLAGKTYVLGTGEALTSDGAGNWKLKPESVLKDGTYDVVLNALDDAGKASSTTSSLVIDAVGPASPAIFLYANDASPPAIKGTWAEGDATSLKVSVPNAGLEAALDDSSGALASDGKGNWSFTVSKKLDPGSYDVVVESADKIGRKSFDQTRFEVNVKGTAVAAAPPPAPVQPAPPSYDCTGVLAKISAIFPIRFAFNDTHLRSPLDVAMNQYAALLKDGRCAALKAEIAGHADFYGPRLYNQALSEARAQTVVTALVAAGVDAARLSTRGFNESLP